jgi:hypothetical protein
MQLHPLALYLSRRAPSARADLSSDKERLGSIRPLLRDPPLESSDVPTQDDLASS